MRIIGSFYLHNFTYDVSKPCSLVKLKRMNLIWYHLTTHENNGKMETQKMLLFLSNECHDLCQQSGKIGSFSLLSNDP